MVPYIGMRATAFGMEGRNTKSTLTATLMCCSFLLFILFTSLETYKAMVYVLGLAFFHHQRLNNYGVPFSLLNNPPY